MKIIKHGKKYDDGKPIKGECDFCGCLVEVNKKEIKYTSDQQDEDFYSVRCPECNGLIYFDL